MFSQLTLQQRDRIREHWLGAIIATYPADTVRFLRSRKNRFANPVGQTLQENIGKLTDGLWSDADPAALQEPLAKILRIRAVQEFSPSQAVAFVFALKPIFREALSAAELADIPDVEMDAFDRRIDEIGLLGFDIYMQLRERSWEIRSHELRNRTHLLLERTGFFGSQSSE